MKEVRWVQPNWKQREYELRDGDATLARLQFRGTWKETVTIFLDSEELTIASSGFWRTRYTILRGDREIAVYNGEGGRKQLVFMTGRRFSWKTRSVWSSAYSFVAEDNEVLMTFRNKGRWLRAECLVELAPSSYKYPELRLLMAFGWFLKLKQSQAAATAAAAS
jgi:hypothetical protein